MAEKDFDLNLMATEEEEELHSTLIVKKEEIHFTRVIGEQQHLTQVIAMEEVMAMEEEQRVTPVIAVEEEQHLIQVTTEEIDLNLSLGYDSSKETPIPYLFIPLANSSQTNISLMEMQMFFPSPSPNPNIDMNFDPNPSMASFSNNSFSLGSSSHNTSPPNAANPPNADKTVSAAKRGVRRSRRTSRGGRRSKGVKETVPQPFPWATNKRATVHNQQYLLENNVRTIKGKIHCKKCVKDFELGLDLEDKLGELCKLIQKENGFWHNRAPAVWSNPVFPKCAFCGRRTTTRPIVEKNKKEINWLFLFLGQMLGCCTLEHLKYFCKHNNIHRTGAKDRLLYLTYTNLVKQLVPDFPVS